MGSSSRGGGDGGGDGGAGGGGGGGGSSLGSGNGHMCIVIFMSGSIVVSQAEGTIMPESGPIRS